MRTLILSPTRTAFQSWFHRLTPDARQALGRTTLAHDPVQFRGLIGSTGQVILLGFPGWWDRQCGAHLLKAQERGVEVRDLEETEA